MIATPRGFERSHTDREDAVSTAAAASEGEERQGMSTFVKSVAAHSAVSSADDDSSIQSRDAPFNP
jgi:hypothetical protein